MPFDPQHDELPDPDPDCPVCEGKGVVRVLEEATATRSAWELCPVCTPAAMFDGPDDGPGEEGVIDRPAPP